MIEGGIYTVHIWRWCKMIHVHIDIQLYCHMSECASKVSSLHMSECFLSKVLVRFQAIDNKDSAIYNH